MNRSGFDRYERIVDENQEDSEFGGAFVNPRAKKKGFARSSSRRRNKNESCPPSPSSTKKQLSPLKKTRKSSSSQDINSSHRSFGLDPSSKNTKSDSDATASTAPSDPSESSCCSRDATFSKNTMPPLLDMPLTSCLRSPVSPMQPSYRARSNPVPNPTSPPRKKVPLMSPSKSPSEQQKSIATRDSSLDSSSRLAKRSPTPGSRERETKIHKIPFESSSMSDQESSNRKDEEEYLKEKEDRASGFGQARNLKPETTGTLFSPSGVHPIIVSDPALSPTISMTFDRLSLASPAGRVSPAASRSPARRRVKPTKVPPHSQKVSSLEEIREKNRKSALSRNATKKPPTPPRSRNHHTAVITKAVVSEISRPEIGHRVFATI